MSRRMFGNCGMVLGLLLLTGISMCGLNSHAQEPNDPSAVSASFGATVDSFPDPILTPGEYDAATRKADVCTDKYATVPPIPDAIAEKVWASYKQRVPEAFRREWTLVFLVSPLIGGKVSVANLFPLHNGAYYSAPQVADLAKALRKKTCNGGADTDGKLLNAMRAEVADNWVSVHVQEVGSLFPSTP